MLLTVTASNENKMSDGGRERASIAPGVWKPSQKWSAQRSAVRSIAWLGLKVFTAQHRIRSRTVRCFLLEVDRNAPVDAVLLLYSLGPRENSILLLSIEDIANDNVRAAIIIKGPCSVD